MTDQSFDESKQEDKLDLSATVHDDDRGLKQRTYFDTELSQSDHKLSLGVCDGSQNQMNE